MQRALPFRAAVPTKGPVRPHRGVPAWLALLLLFVAIWLGVRILENVTEALTGIVTGPQTHAAQSWPDR